MRKPLNLLAIGVSMLIAGLVVVLLNTSSTRATQLCGNGAIDSPWEECDDGNTADGDCCSATCKLDPPGVHCDNNSVCAKEGACDGAGWCIDVGCRVGAFCAGACSPTYCKYTAAGGCGCSGQSPVGLPDCASQTSLPDDDDLLDAAIASLEAKGLPVSQIPGDDFQWILLTEVSPIAGCEIR